MAYIKEVTYTKIGVAKKVLLDFGSYEIECHIKCRRSHVYQQLMIATNCSVYYSYFKILRKGATYYAPGYSMFVGRVYGGSELEEEEDPIPEVVANSNDVINEYLDRLLTTEEHEVDVMFRTKYKRKIR